jgi:hypothetical protein
MLTGHAVRDTPTTEYDFLTKYSMLTVLSSRLTYWANGTKAAEMPSAFDKHIAK